MLLVETIFDTANAKVCHLLTGALRALSFENFSGWNHLFVVSRVM